MTRTHHPPDFCELQTPQIAIFISLIICGSASAEWLHDLVSAGVFIRALFFWRVIYFINMLLIEMAAREERGKSGTENGCTLLTHITGRGGNSS